jgi:very-short-patch-repair endonuclease
MLAIEIDGNSHHFKDAEVKDAFRQQRLESLGVRFIRFSDILIKKDMNSVIWALTDRISELRGATSP